ncbi:hypothetical protein BS47DRAFT_1352120 [Hydnum rufescens UP504]|uniref:Uncharacterized protein n=1 Tax=Hydnum rufescens UP504 TaxID=1448309 RepID=A0A9P6DLK8_9AGAM|nr:hypothetical protein BS47DRAFT_1352120 [Hydnum rufescens UP504]
MRVKDHGASNVHARGDDTAKCRDTQEGLQDSSGVHSLHEKCFKYPGLSRVILIVNKPTIQMRNLTNPEEDKV